MERIKSRGERSAPEVNEIARERRGSETQVCRTPTRDDQGQTGRRTGQGGCQSVEILLFLSYISLSSHFELIACFYYSWLQGSWQGPK